MSEITTAIMDAAERHICVGGYGAFSFRDIAGDVGVKSSSVHYHFPTKEKLAIAVIERYRARISDLLDGLFKMESDPVKVATTAFASITPSAGCLCPCAVMGASILYLPAEVSAKIREYFAMWYDKLEANGLARERAIVLISSLLGSQLLATIEYRPLTFHTVAENALQRFGNVQR